jgi:hypothetical protein
MLYCDYWQCCESGSCVSSCKLCNRRTSSLPPPAVSLGMLGLFCSRCNPTEKRTRRTSPRLVRRCFSRTSSHLVTSVTGMFPSPPSPTPSPSALHSPPIAFSHHLPIYNNGGRRGESRQLSQPWTTGTLPAPAPNFLDPVAQRPEQRDPRRSRRA